MMIPYIHILSLFLILLFCPLLLPATTTTTTVLINDGQVQDKEVAPTTIPSKIVSTGENILGEDAVVGVKFQVRWRKRRRRSRRRRRTGDKSKQRNGNF